MKALLHSDSSESPACTKASLRSGGVFKMESILYTLECSCIRKNTASASRCGCKNMVILVTKGFVWCPVSENHLCQKKYKKRGTSLSSMTPVYTYCQL